MFEFLKSFNFDNIIEFLLQIFYYISNLLFGWFQLPVFPSELSESIDTFLNLIFNNLSLLSLIIRPITFFTSISLLILYFNFEILYKVLIWLIRKIPFLNLK